MKTLSITLLLFVLSSFSTTNTKENILFKDEYGTLDLKKDFIVVNYSTEKYLEGKGKYVQMLVFLNHKNYIGTVDEKEYLRNKTAVIKKFQEKLKNTMRGFSYNDKSLRMEMKHNRCYFFYYEQLIELEFGKLMTDGRYCVGGHKSELQCKEKNIIVTLYYDGAFVYGERIFKDEHDNIKSSVDFTPEHRKSVIY